MYMSVEPEEKAAFSVSRMMNDDDGSSDTRKESIVDIKKSLVRLDCSALYILVRNFILFSVMGSGANFVLPSALYQELPYFQDNLPEKQCIATYMNLANSFGLFAMLSYLYYNDYVKPIPYTVSVPTMLVVSAVTSFLSAFIYPFTAGDVSLPLYACLFIGGSVGACSSIIMSPFMAAYTNDNISASRAGGSGGALLAAIISAIQEPGSSNQLFSVTVYLIIFSVILSLAVPAYIYIIRKQIGLRPPQITDVDLDLKHQEALTGVMNMDISTTNPMSNKVGDDIDNANPNTGRGSLNIVAQSHKSHKSWRQLDDEIDVMGIKLAGLMEALGDRLISEQQDKQYPWLRPVLPYLITVGWINFNTWGIISAIIPFAIANAFNSTGAGVLNIALVVGAITLTLGDLSTVLFHLHILWGTVMFSIMCLVLYIATFNPPGFHSAAAGPMIIIVYAVGRFLEAHLVTISLRKVASKFPLIHREPASRAIGISNQICSTAGAVFSTIIVVSLLPC